MDHRPGIQCSRQLERTLSSVREARHLLRDLAGDTCPELLTTAELLLTELITNAVKYQNATESWVAFQYCWTAPVLTIDVFNPGQAFEQPEAAQQIAEGLISPTSWDQPQTLTEEVQEVAALSESGRGLWLVESMADDWGIQTIEPLDVIVTREPEVCHVWFSCVNEPATANDSLASMFAADIADLLG